MLTIIIEVGAELQLPMLGLLSLWVACHCQKSIFKALHFQAFLKIPFYTSLFILYVPTLILLSSLWLFLFIKVIKSEDQIPNFEGISHTYKNKGWTIPRYKTFWNFWVNSGLLIVLYFGDYTSVETQKIIPRQDMCI